MAMHGLQGIALSSHVADPPVLGLVLEEVFDYTRSRKTLTPSIWIARRVQYAVDSHRACHILVEDRIREATHQPSAIVLMDDCIHLRHEADRCHHASTQLKNSSPKPTRRASYHA